MKASMVDKLIAISRFSSFRESPWERGSGLALESGCSAIKTGQLVGTSEVYRQSSSESIAVP